MRGLLSEMAETAKRQDYIFHREVCMGLKEGDQDDPWEEEDEYLDQLDNKLTGWLKEAEEKHKRQGR